MAQPVGLTQYRLKDLIALKQYDRGDFTIDFTAGRIYRPNGRELVGYKSKKGYVYVNLYENGVCYKTLKHRIIYVCYQGLCGLNIGEDLEVDHIDGDKTNNSILNLRMVTGSENCRNPNTIKYGEKTSQAKFTNETAEEIRSLYLEGGNTCSSIAQMFSVSIDTTWKIIANKTYPSTTMIATRAAEAMKNKPNRRHVFAGWKGEVR